LNCCDLVQIDLLWTILQPIAHRDLVYHSLDKYPGFNFKKYSTPTTRRFVSKKTVSIIKNLLTKNEKKYKALFVSGPDRNR
jgi:hypothetical protein